MTNRELVALLQQLPPDFEVVVDLHSEFQHVAAPELLEGYESGGYVSAPYPRGQGISGPPTRMYIYIGWTSNPTR